jgi:hypothetical protein
MTRILFLLTWLFGPRFVSRFIFFYALGILFLFYCLIGGLMSSYVPAAPAHAIQSPYPPMPKPNPIPPNTAEVMRKRMTSGPQMRLNVPAPESAAKPVPYE